MPDSQSDIEVRSISGDDVEEWVRTWNTAYLRPPSVEIADFLRDGLLSDRAIGAFELDRCVGTYRSAFQELTVPGGNVLPVSAISKVSVVGTHRRRGLLTRMVQLDLQRAMEREEPLIVLDAAQHSIYGRYGFGPGTSMAWFEIDVHRTRLDPRRTEDLQGVEVVDPLEYRKLASEAYERFRVMQPGALGRGEAWWQEFTGERVPPGATWAEPYYAVFRAPNGQVDGLLCFTAEETWGSMVPESPLQVRDLIGLTPEAERALVRYAATIDWVSKVYLPYRSPDSLVPYWLGDPRAARVTTLTDYMWIRMLDVPSALAARTYGLEASLVVRVYDKAGFADGTWLLDGSADGASCVRTSQSADITLDVQELASLYLGDESATRLADLGRLEAARPDSVVRADAMFRTGRRPWSPRAATGTQLGQAKPGS
ncbi:GNAT family N-acetyltransferase [Streptomyces sp. CAI-21]|uniref:GNAT family N-acetyltransferase n=1 Tax=Streptomyces sp. CAI-21 TaxID=1169743 RepID=UPI001587A32A|nr:GNAT family N-acetyltransferase [Streptomyces sp. CAI-21]